MSSQSRRGGGKRNADETELTPEETVKKQKNREAAKKHREKKVKTLQELEAKNKELETQRANLIKDKEGLKKLVLYTENLIRQHKMAGCHLPLELQEELENFGVNFMSENLENSIKDDSPSASMEENATQLNGVSLTSTSSPNSPLSAGEKRPAVSQDPAVALFSGTPLHSGPSVTTAKPQAPLRQSGTSSPVRHKNFNVHQQNHQSLLALDQQEHFSGVQISPEHCHSTEHVEVCLVPTSSSHEQQHEAVAMANRATSIASCQNGSLVLQGPVQIHGESTAREEANLWSVMIDGQPYLVKSQSSFRKQPQAVTATLTSSLVTQETLNPASSSQVYQEQRVVNSCNASEITGNIPTAELLENFEQPNNINISTGEHLSDMAHTANTAGTTFWDSEGYDYLTDTGRQLPTPVPDNYSYTDDLNQSENPQMILDEIQEQTFDLNHRTNPLRGQTMEQTSLLSGSASSVQPADLGSLPPPNACPVTDHTSNETPVTTSCMQSSPAFAPAILDLLSTSQITAGLHNQFIAFASSVSTSPDSLGHRAGNLSGHTPQPPVARSQMAVAGSNTGARLVYQNQGQVLSVTGCDKNYSIVAPNLLTNSTYIQNPHRTPFDRL